eukprot:764515-Hanusia_phi.AAC.5
MNQHWLGHIAATPGGPIRTHRGHGDPPGAGAPGRGRPPGPGPSPAHSRAARREPGLSRTTVAAMCHSGLGPGGQVSGESRGPGTVLAATVTRLLAV